MKAVGIHLPDRSHFSDKSDKIFVKELFAAIAASGRYTPLRINLKRLDIKTEEDAKSYVGKQNIAFIIEHDSSFYSSNENYKRNVSFLRECIPFFNSYESQKIAHDKITTKRVLSAHSVPVLPDAVLDTPEALLAYMEESRLYVVKPARAGAGAGVRLIRRNEKTLERFLHGKWKGIEQSGGMFRGSSYILLRHHPQLLYLALVAGLLGVAWWIPLSFPGLSALSVLIVAFAFDLFMRTYDRGFIYQPMLVEPYFNENETSFSSLRCTVIGNKVVEAVKRTNTKNITSNISNGGTAECFELTESQKAMAVAAVGAIGADYAGVDFLVKEGESVVGEVNIGPFTLFGTYTGAQVGTRLAEYVIGAYERKQANIDKSSV